jgi:hypothetical protein
MRLAAQVPYDVMVEAGRPHDVENYANGTYTARVPVLLTDGEHEDPRDLAFLRDVAARMGPETDYWTTPGTDHYLHTDRLIHEPHRWATDYLRNVPCYDERVLGGFVTAVDRWLRTGVAPGQ